MRIGPRFVCTSLILRTSGACLICRILAPAMPFQQTHHGMLVKTRRWPPVAKKKNGSTTHNRQSALQPNVNAIRSLLSNPRNHPGDAVCPEHHVSTPNPVLARSEYRWDS